MMWDPRKDDVCENETEKNERAYKSKNVNWSTNCGLNKCIIAWEDYISVVRQTRRMENVLWRGHVISVCRKWKTNGFEWYDQAEFLLFQLFLSFLPSKRIEA